MKTIAVLMTCFNRAETTLRCLRHLYAQDVPAGYSFEVWLVDDASPDKTGEKVTEKFPLVHVVRGNGKLFWCRGMRKAWDCACAAKNYDYYLWLNDDVELYYDALKTALSDDEAVSNNPLRVMTGAFHDEHGSEHVHYCTYQLNRENIVPNGKFPQEGHYWFAGNFVLVPREVYMTVGPISGEFHHAYGDGDYSKRLVKAEIPFFIPSKVLGVCPFGNVKEKPLRELPLLERIRLLWAPTGLHIGDAMRWSYRYRGGAFAALLTFFHLCYVALFGVGKVRR